MFSLTFDHFDAACVFECLALRAFRQHGEVSPEFEEMRTMEGCHRKRMNDECFAKEKASVFMIYDQVAE